jgi:hypothetical protein
MTMMATDVITVVTMVATGEGRNTTDISVDARIYGGSGELTRFVLTSQDLNHHG